MLRLLRKFFLPLFMGVALVGCGVGTTTVAGGSSVAPNVYAINSTTNLSVTAESQTSAAVVLFGDSGSSTTTNFNVALSVVDANESPVESSVIAVTTDPSSCSLNVILNHSCSIYVQSNESNLTESAHYLIKTAVTSVATGVVTNLTPIALTVTPTNESTPDMESGVIHFTPSSGSLSLLDTYTGIVSLDNSRNVSNVTATVTNNQGPVNTCILSTTNNTCEILMEPGSWSGTNTETYTVAAPGYTTITASFTISGS